MRCLRFLTGVPGTSIILRPIPARCPIRRRTARKLSGRLRSLGFTAGSTVVTRNGNLASIISSASIDSTFGVTGSNETNTAVFLSNGDGLTNDTDITSQYRDGNWYAKFSGGSNGAVRINYMVVRWNLS